MRFGRALAPLLLPVLVAACSGAAASPSPSAPPASAPPSAVASAAPSAVASAAPSTAPSTNTSGGGYDAYGGGTAATPAPSAPTASGSIALAKTGLGTILVGPTGMTLYMFTPDSSTSSACNGVCASTWPPLTGALPKLGAGLSAADFGSITRSDGSAQVTFHGHPLYYYGGDTAVGNTNGQGLLGKWYVLGADGNPIK